MTLDGNAEKSARAAVVRKQNMKYKSGKGT